MRALLLWLVSVVLSGAASAQENGPPCPLPLGEPPVSFDLSLSWEEQSGERHFVSYAGGSTQFNHLYWPNSRAPDWSQEGLVVTNADLLDQEWPEQITEPLWHLAREVICGITFDSGDGVTMHFHAAKVELWLGYGGEELGVRFLREEASDAAVALRSLLARLLDKHNVESKE